MEINDIIYGNPTQRQRDLLRGPGRERYEAAVAAGVVSEFLKNPPPRNEDRKTAEELEHLTERIAELSDEEKRLCRELDSKPYDFFEREFTGMGIPIRAEELEKYIEPYLGILIYVKDWFNRPRPWQLAAIWDLPLYPVVNSGTANSASYPSGHTFEFLLIVDMMSRRHPEHLKEITDLYRRIREVREWSGLHYPSDTRGAERLFRLCKESGIID